MVIDLNSVDTINKHFAIPSLHSSVSVFDLSEIKPLDNHHCKLGIYAIICRIDNEGNGIVHFFAPSNTIAINTRENPIKGGCGIFFHPSLLDDTLLAHRMSEYPFFQYAPHDEMHLSGFEMQIVSGCIKGIGNELKQCNDRFTKRIIVSGIALLLSYCLRYYNNEYASHHEHSDIIKRLNILLNSHYACPAHERCELPTVAWCAKQLHLSPNYFGDIVKRQSNQSAQDYIHQRIIAEARLMLDRGRCSISEISYHLGFKYPHHLTRVFKRILGITPNEYRAQLQKK